jgi:hypothetical protein
MILDQNRGSKPTIAASKKRTSIRLNACERTLLIFANSQPGFHLWTFDQAVPFRNEQSTCFAALDKRLS